MKYYEVDWDTFFDIYARMMWWVFVMGFVWIMLINPSNKYLLEFATFLFAALCGMVLRMVADSIFLWYVCKQMNKSYEQRRL